MSQVQLDVETATGAPLLLVSRLKVYFSQSHGFFRRYSTTVKAVNDVSFALDKSEILSLVGESGSGKTTIGRCIAGLAWVKSGSIKLGTTEVTTLRGKELRQYHKDVQMVFQDPYASLNPRRNVLTTIALPIRRLTGEQDSLEIKKKVASLLSEVGLDRENSMHKLPHQLSGGERQRVNIARALASDPQILVADEPTSMLDASQRLNVLALLEQLRAKRKLTILLITHDLASAKRMGGRTAIMYQGKLVEAGPTQTILSRPHHPYTELLLASSPRLELSSKRYEEKNFLVQGLSSSDLSEMVGGCIYRSRCKYATEICAKEEPQLVPKFPPSSVACHNPINA